MYVGLEQIALRNSALYVPCIHTQATMTDASAEFVANLSNLYSVSEPLLHALNGASPEQLKEIREAVAHIFRTDANWTPLVRYWHTPTGESGIDHLITYWANRVGHSDMPGVRLSCGHFIPEVAFDISRYNGCPFCGRPLEFEPGALQSNSMPREVLGLMTDDDMLGLRDRLLSAPIPPDATTAATLRTLLTHYGVSQEVLPATREALLLTSEALDEAGRTAEAYALLNNPDDLLRYLRYRTTGSLAFRSPKTYRGKNLKFKFARPQARAIAQCLENMEIPADRMAEIMHPRRGLWVRLIRAARLAEFARKEAFPRLRLLLDVFYRGDYPVFAGTVQKYYDGRDARGVRMLEARPGLFARSLFAWMLRIGPADPLIAFAESARSISGRLLYSLFASAEVYFMPDGGTRTVTPGHGMQPAVIKVNPGIKAYSDSERADMVLAIKDIFIAEMRRRYAENGPAGASVYIAPELFDVPMPVGDRSATVSDIQEAALSGQRFKVEGDSLRLFLQWGVGLPAQPLDMDLSAAIIYPDHVDECAYYNLSPIGCRHSGDIRQIPDRVGTAEYVELDLNVLAEAGAVMAVFTCNAFSVVELSPNLVFGWMSSASPMALDESTGVAYDPADVQRMMRVPDNYTARGIMFGVLDIRSREITWLEMPFNGRTLRSLNLAAVSGILNRMRSKPSIGELLAVRAEALGSTRVDSAAFATEAYGLDWASQPDVVAKLLLPPPRNTDNRTV